MPRWKRDFLSKMKIQIKVDAGFTLVELLASLALLSLVISLLGSVAMFGLKQYNLQIYSASQSNDYSYSMSLLSKEIRRAENIEVGDGSITVDGVAYRQQGSQLLENESRIIADDLKEAQFEVKDKNVVIKLIGNNGEEYHTTIHLRR